MSNAIAVSQLKDTLAERFPDAQPLVYRTAQCVATGIESLDRLFPGGGLPRGRLVVWRPGGGATAVLRATCGSVIGRGERAAWIDTAGQVIGDGWSAGPLLIRPVGGKEALECAEDLARCGGFGLIVLGAGAGLQEVPVRLGRAVREGGGVLVVQSADTSQAQLRIESRLSLEEWKWRRDPFGEAAAIDSARLVVSAWAMGWSGRTTFRLPVLSHETRLALDPLLVDRRGAPRRSVWPDPKRRDTVGRTSRTTSNKRRNSLSESNINSINPVPGPRSRVS